MAFCPVCLNRTCKNSHDGWKLVTVSGTVILAVISVILVFIL